MVGPDVVERVAVADDVTLHVRRWHGGGRRPVVLLHGLASNARLWDGVADRLQRTGHPVAAVDLRGHGRSDKPDVGYDVATVAGDVARLVEDLGDRHGWARPLVAGQSWGGNVAIELAASRPGLTAGVVGVDGGTIELAERFPSWEACAEALRPPALAGTPLADVEEMLRAAHPDWPETGIDGTLACFEVRSDATVAPWLTLERHLLVLRGLWDHRPSERYAQVEEPVLLLGADPGPAGGPRHLEQAAAMEAAGRALRDGHVAWMGGDHDLHAQHPCAVADVLAGFAEETGG